MGLIGKISGSSNRPSLTRPTQIDQSYSIIGHAQMTISRAAADLRDEAIEIFVYSHVCGSAHCVQLI